MQLKILLIIPIIFSINSLFAQNNTTDSLHDHTEHSHHKNELGVAISPVYFVKEDLFSYGIHLHYSRNITNTKFAFGLGYERIFDDHKHNTVGFVASYRPIDKLSFNLSPGITFEDHANRSYEFAMHIETAYEFEIGNFHIGPSLEFAFEPEDYHISLGLHLGFGF